MKKMYVSLIVVGAALAFTYCSSPKKASAAAVATPRKINYADNIMAIVQTNCAPCHIPDKGGNKKPLDTYAAVSAQIDDVIRRVSLQPNERGFMPRMKPRLSDSTINVLKTWKAQGLLEK